MPDDTTDGQVKIEDGRYWIYHNPPGEWSPQPKGGVISPLDRPPPDDLDLNVVEQ